MSELRGYIFDAEDLSRISQYKWHKERQYLVTSFRCKDWRGDIRLHHFLIGRPLKPMIVDHINGNPKDNRKVNLRITTQRINRLNSRIAKNNTSGCTGVSWNNGAWEVRDSYDRYSYRTKNKDEAFDLRRRLCLRAMK